MSRRRRATPQSSLLAAAAVVVVVAVLTTTADASNKQLTQLEEKLSTDREFYDQWMQLVQLQAVQLMEQEKEHPLDYVLREAAACATVDARSGVDVNSLAARDLAIYADLGQISSFCPANYTLFERGILGACNQRAGSMTLPSLPKLFRTRNPNLAVVHANNLDDPLPKQASAISAAIQAIPGHEDVWKFVAIMANIQDGSASETGQTAIEVLMAVQELAKKLPLKTIVVVLRTSGSGIWSDATHAMPACRTQLAQWKMHNKYNYNSVWDQVEIIVQKNYVRGNFTVEILPLFRDPALNNLSDGADLSVLGYDCAHFSERGLSLLHLAVWNTLVTRNPSRSHQYRPSAEPLLCADPKCPFLRTAANSDKCIWVYNSDAMPSAASRLIVVAVLMLTLALALLILFFVCRSRRVGVNSKAPVKAFGASFSSIKFIDEDVV